MTFTKRTNCVECNSPLHLQDINSTMWKDDVHEFVFICSTCGKENIVKKNLFTQDGHITKAYLSILQTNKDYIAQEQLDKIMQHFETCPVCKQAVDEQQLAEVEDQIKFNEKSLAYFESNGKKPDLVAEVSLENGHPKTLIVAETKYELYDNDLFFKKEEHDTQQLYYYLREGFCLTGMAELSLLNNHAALNRIWIRAKSDVQKELEFFQDLKEKKVKIKLEYLKRLFQNL